MEPSELKSMITIPTEENLNKIDFSELLVKLEFKAVIKVKLQFFKWFEELIRNILKNNQKFIKKDKKIKEDEEEDQIITTAIEEDTSKILNKDNTDDELCTDEDSIVNNPQLKL